MFVRKATDDRKIFDLHKKLEYYQSVRQAGLTLYVVRVTSVKFVLREGNMRFNTPNEGSVSVITYTDNSRKSL